MDGQKVTLEFLQRLSDDGQQEALQTAMAWCSTKELRSFCGGMGVRVRSKEYAAYHTKAGYTELLLQLLRAESASKGLAVGPAPPPLVLTPVERTRRTKNCNLRLLNVLFSDSMSPFLSSMNAEPTAEEVAAGAMGGMNPFWTRFRAEYASDKPEYSRVAFQALCLVGFDLSTPVPHSSTKLSEMWAELREAYNSALIRFTHSNDPNVDFVHCCPSRSDVFYMRCWLDVKPNLLSDVCVKMSTSLGLSSILLEHSTRGSEEAVAAAAGNEGNDHATPSRKRSRSSITRATRENEFVAASEEPIKNTERALLMQSIRHAVDTLAMARGLDLGPEVEETVRCELQRCTKRLKRIQLHEADEDEETKNGDLSC